MTITSHNVPSGETEVKLEETVQAEQPPKEKETSAGGEGLDPKRWIALLVLLIAAFMDMLDSTVANVAAPSMQRDLGAGYAAVQWILVGYQVAFAMMLILGGRLGDIFGRKKVFLLGMAGFTLVSITAGLAQEPWQLVISRVLQGAFAGVMVPQVLAIIHVTFPDRERGTAFALYGVVAGLAAALGLAAGGLLVQWNLFNLDWRLVFLINAPVGLACLLMGPKVIRESKAPRALRLDVIGVVLASAVMLMLLYPLLQGRELGWPVWGYVLMIAAVPTLGGFLLWQRHKIRTDGSPLVELNLFRTRSFSSGLIVQLAFYIGTGMFFLGWTLYMQIGLGWTPMRAGLTSLPFCIGAFLTSSAAMIALVPKYGRKVLQYGIVIVLLGLGGYIWVAGEYGADITSWHLALPLLFIGMGFGLVAAPLPEIVTSETPHQDAGSASGIVNTNTQLGFAIGGALVSVVFFGGLVGNTTASATAQAAELRQELVATAGVSEDRANEIVTAFGVCQADRAAQKDHSVVPPSCAEPVLQGEPVADVLAEGARDVTGRAFASSFQTTLWVYGAIAVLAFFLMFTIPRRLRAEDWNTEGEDDGDADRAPSGTTASAS
ncbi:MFS transporter [Streptomyces sp. JJ66]|uniref:MFS transporter n=1 Tax=Streptomyces sp. JJ66 TaxID=2803843 RepID=UPI001C588484|nr:MFS transporter [Streptomyces sp. JJ66]MBW1602500.1 MFS transporter [Streptomyces sp. JJ66]